MSKYTRSLKKPSIKGKSQEVNPKQNQDKEILSLLTQNLSPNKIVQHYKNIGKRHITYISIRKTLLDYKKRIEEINKKLDKIASHQISIMEWDETFKGFKQKILVVFDSITGYVYRVKYLEKKSEECLRKALNPIRHILSQAKVVLTDGAPYFPALVKDLCPSAAHQICLVHVMRGLNSELRKLKNPYSEALEKLRKEKNKITSNKKKRKEKSYNKKKLMQKHTYHVNKRVMMQKSRGVSPGQKGILKMYPELRKKNKIINVTSIRLTSVKRTLNSTKNRIKATKIRIKILEKEKFKQWNLYMKERRIYRQFYDLFFKHNEQFIKEKTAMINKLKKEKLNPLRQKILDLLERVKGIDAINRTQTLFPLKRQYLNTNGIESFNSRFRPLLDSLRNIPNTPYIEARFQLFRLFINTTSPLNPSETNLSPIEKYGYNLRGRSTIDLIVDGLPPGPQPKIFIPKITTELIARKVEKSAIFS